MQASRLKFIILLFSLVLASVLPAVTPPAKAIPYAVLRHSPQQDMLFLGTVRLYRSVELSFLSNVQLTYVAPVNEFVHGKITDREGKIIREGDIVAKARDIKEQIVVNIATQKLKKAALALKDAHLNLQRIEKLYTRNVVSARQREEAEKAYLQAVTDHDVCRLEQLEAAENLDNMVLRAPFSGIIEKVFTSAGSSLRDDQSILVLSAFDPACVKIKLHDVMTDLICTDDEFLIYPAGFTHGYRGWLNRQEIFTDYIELSVENRLVPKQILTAGKEKLPKVYSQARIIKVPEMPNIPLWVPTEVLKKDDRGAYIWIVASLNRPDNSTENAKVLTVRKIRVTPRNMFIQKRSARYEALETAANLGNVRVVLIKTEGKLTDGGQAVVQEYNWLFQPREKVWVSIPQLAKYIYTVPVEALHQLDGHTFISIIDADNKVFPVEVFVYNRRGKTAEIIGKNLRPGMKIACSQDRGVMHMNQKVTPGKELNF
ncbi:MAG: hypothetical protein PHH77_11285 [Victivallaceae bacterium]|nr:hypothetical protein [Victivallaceae bacterium]